MFHLAFGFGVFGFLMQENGLTTGVGFHTVASAGFWEVWSGVSSCWSDIDNAPINRETGEVWLAVCPNNRRNAETLLPLIQQHVKR